MTTTPHPARRSPVMDLLRAGVPLALLVDLALGLEPAPSAAQSPWPKVPTASTIDVPAQRGPSESSSWR